MKKHLLPENGQFYKANMHCHTNLSDGWLTPEEVKKAYSEKGYSIVAFTDHENLFYHNDLSDKNFLAINGFEADISQRICSDNNYIKCYHFNAFALFPADRGPLPQKPEYDDIDAINDYIAKLNKQGFLVCYNHPYWSLQTLDDYRHLKGIFACEIFNYCSYMVDGIDGNNTHVYDTLLRLGHRIYCMATDDNHNRGVSGVSFADSFGGFIMIKAEELTYSCIMNAIQKGDFYASAGPEINELWVEDNTVTVTSSPCAHIALSTSGRRGERIVADDCKPLEHAVFKLNPADTFFRLEVTDEKGLRANTRAYFLDEI